MCIRDSQKVFPLLENNSNTTLIITDGDCDPTIDGANPFQKALTLFPNRTFIVWNVKQTKMCFPYTAMDERVCYLSGSETGMIEAVLKRFPKTPEDLLESCLADFECPSKIEAVKDSTFTEFEKQLLYTSILHNIPPLREEHAQSDDDENEDEDLSDVGDENE
jgi:hypothetical protein